MKLLNLVLAFLVTISTWDVFACKNLVTKFVEKNETLDPKESAREITAIFSCRGDTFKLPGATAMHFIEEKSDGSVCYYERVCGNLKSWGVYLGIELDLWQNQSTLEYALSSEGLDRFVYEAEGNLFGISVGLATGTIERYCKPKVESICV